MTQVEQVGVPAGDKPINLSQLQGELEGMGVSTSGLGMLEGFVHTYDADGQPIDFPSDQRTTVEQAISDHLAMRNKTSEEYAAEFQEANTSAARKQEIRDIQNGLLPPEQVPL